MDQEKTGKFIAGMRKRRGLTQQELADRLGVTDRAVSNWENGRRLPDYGLVMNLCRELGITLNDLFMGEMIEEHEFKDKADENLLKALKSSSFTLEERIDYFRRKWKREHVFDMVMSCVTCVLLAIIMKWRGCENLLVVTTVAVIGMVLYLIHYNKLMKYVEYRAYRSTCDAEEESKEK